MNITLKKDSWHFKIYSKVFCKEPPKSLCPYFWSWVCMIAISPFLLPSGLGYLIGELFNKKREPKKSINQMTDDEVRKEIKRSQKRFRREELFGKMFLIFWAVASLAVIIVGMVMGIKKVGWFEFFRNMLTLVGLCTIVFGTTTLFFKNINKIGNWNVIKIPVAMIKSIYTKTCPIINWK